MTSRTPPKSNYRVVLILAICLLATFTGVILVGAHNDDNTSASADQVTTAQQNAAAKTRIAEQFGQLPLSFEINKGQIDESVKFLSHGAGYDLFLTATEAVLRLQKPPDQPADKSKGTPADAGVREGTVLRLRMLGANATPHVEGQEELPGKIHYITGNDPAKWRRNIPIYRRAYFKNVYPGIDVVYYGNQRELEYDYVVAAGANPKLIRFTVAGAGQIRLDKAGRLRLNLKHGEVTLNKPVIYQLDENGSRHEIKGGYVIKGNEVRFKLERFDSRKPLIIDPVLLYSTLLGSGSNDQAFGIAVDSQGSAYVTGITEGTTFPTTAGAFKAASTRSGAFVTKLDPTGSALVYSTYISGEGTTTGTGIAVDSSGNAHITGTTSARDFPIVNGLKTTSNFFKTGDAAANWNNQNSGLVGEVFQIAVAPNAADTIYAVISDGLYRSTDAGATWTKTPANGLSNASSASALAVDPTNSSVVYIGLNGLFKSTDGGNNWSAVTLPVSFSFVKTIVFDPATPSTMYIGGSNGVFKSTDSGANWITQNNFNVAGTPSVRTLAIDPTTPLTIYAGTFNNGLFKSTSGGGVWTAMNNGMGGPNPTSINAIAIDPSNTATIYTGHNFPGGINKSINGGASWTLLTNDVPQDTVHAIVATSSAVYAAVGANGVIKSTNGGTNWTSANAGLWSSFVPILVVRPGDPSVLYAGTGLSAFFPDAFVTKLNAAGSDVLFSTLLGGTNDEAGNGIAVDGSGNIYVVGHTTSLNFPVANAVQSAPATPSCFDGFVTKLNPAVPSYVFSTYLRGSHCDSAHSVAVDSSGNVYVTGTTGSTDFPSANAFQPTLSGGQFQVSDAFVTKLTTDGALTYSTYLGGTSSETGFGITADASGNAYITGVTNSSNFPTMNPIRANKALSSNSGIFVTKLNSQGSALVYSTYLGGGGNASGRGIAVDSANNVYVAGFTDSSRDFPIVAGAPRTRSGLYKSIDGAASWTNDNYGFEGGSGFVIHPTEPSTIYTGSINGVFKSTNGGRTWSPMNNGLTRSLNVVALVINPSAPSTLYVAVRDFGGGNSGVYKSTDGGNTWSLRNNGINHTDLLSLAIDPVTPNTLYLGVRFCCDGSHIYKTTDGADNWAPIAGAPPSAPLSIVIDPLNHLTIYVGDLVSLISGARQNVIYKSPDAGTTWQNLGLSTFVGPRSNDVLSVSVSPLIAGLVYASTNQGLFRSVDGGTNWSHISSTPGNIVFDPVSASTVYWLTRVTGSFDVNRQGLLKSTDNGQTWIPMNKGLDSLQVGILAIVPQKPSTLYLTSGALGTEAFVTKINPAGSGLLYSTFLGGPPHPAQGLLSIINSQAFGIAVDFSGNAYVTGVTISPGFPVTDSYQPFNRGFNDAFISKLGNSYIISGRVLNNGAPLGETEVVLNDGTSLTTVFTEGDGSYQFSRLREGGNYTISASKPQFTMTPANQTFNSLNSDQVLDFSALTSDSEFHTISGQITENGTPLPGVTVTLSGSQSGLRTTNSNGNYSFELITGGNYTVTPSIVGLTFDPASQTFNGLNANQTANFAATRQSFVVTNANNHGSGSLRAAIINANATPGTDTITFNIPGPGAKTINLLISLPDITDRVVIDATTQPGYAGTPLIELNGSAVSNGNGLVIKAGGSTVRGLAIGGFSGDFSSIFGSGTGIWLDACDNNVIQANYIGIAPDGMTTRQNSRGIQLNNSSNNVIGGTTSAARNVISGNSNSVLISGNTNVVQGNYIGLNATGTGPLPNQFGIWIVSGVGNTIGGTQSGEGNKIAFNDGPGVTISNGTANSIRGNSIFSNTGLGIDLGTTGVTANDGNDGDTGPNQLQNFPVISSVTSTSNSTTIQGSLKSIPNTTFQIDFYSNAAVDPSGNGEGAQFFGTTPVSTNGSGDANIDVTFPIGLAAGRVITATATDPNGNTSEFSAADATGTAGSVHFTRSSIAAIEDVGTFPVTVLRTGGTTGSLTVDYTTTNGTAIAGQDYTSTSGTLTFAAGETSKTIQVSILDDSTTEADETFTLSLSNTPTLESLGAPNTLLVTVKDRTTVPALSINNLTVVEGNTGTTTDALFTINLSASTSRAVNFDFATRNFSAFGGAKCGNGDGVDYVSTFGTFSFPTGTTTFAIPVKICGDTSAETNETIGVSLSNVSGATVIDQLVSGLIIDDDLLGLLLEDSGPNPNQAAAIEAVLALRDPFSLFMPDWYTPGVQENTRVMLFAQNLQLDPGELPSAVTVNLRAGNGVLLSVPAEDVRPLRDTEFTQVIFRLPNPLPPGTCTVSIVAHFRESNSGTIRIAP